MSDIGVCQCKFRIWHPSHKGTKCQECGATVDAVTFLRFQEILCIRSKNDALVRTDNDNDTAIQNLRRAVDQVEDAINTLNMKINAVKGALE